MTTKDGFAYLEPRPRRSPTRRRWRASRKLAIPPAYRDVWICRDPNGHLQAVGRDARGRNSTATTRAGAPSATRPSSARCSSSGAPLPRIREQVSRDLALHGLPRRKVLATIVRLLEMTLARVGNEEYARTNKSFGLTTLAMPTPR